MSEGYLTSTNSTTRLDIDTPIVGWLFDIVAEAFAAKIPDNVDGQLVLDGVINTLKKDCPNEVINGLNTLYLTRVVQALYLTGHNRLLLDMVEPFSDTDEFAYLQGTTDEKLVLFAQGSFVSFDMLKHCHISYSGKVNEIKNCSDSRFDIHGTECPLIKNDTRDCDFYFHDLDRDGIRIKEQSLHNTYFVRDGKDGWERVEFEVS